MKRLVSFVLLFSILLFVCPVNSAAAAITDFSDVNSADWFCNSVNFVTQNGMFNGTDASSFSPNDKMTRGMFVTVLGRYGGAPSVSNGCSLGIVTKSDVNLRSAPSSTNTSVLDVLPSGTQLEVMSTAPDLRDSAYTWYYVKCKGVLGYIRTDLMEKLEYGFSDVLTSAYYSSYVQWAFSSGIASATGNVTFSPERNISREEICSMLYNYADFKNYQLKPSLPTLTFSDNSSVFPDYASAVSTMQQIGVVTGYEDGRFKPKDSATRAEVSAMLMRFVSAISYKPATEASYDSAGNYIFGTEVPPKAAVSSDYFTDACFIGHSLVCGMSANFGLSATDFIAKNGATAKFFLDQPDFKLPSVHIDENGKTIYDIGTLGQALKQKEYRKVYIMLGINEIGASNTAHQSFYDSMNNIVELVKTTQPSALIYIISLTPVSQKCSESRNGENRDNVLGFNAVLKQLCKDRQTYYLNVFDLLCDDNGFLPESACKSDGIHILSSEYAKIKTYLLSHTV